MTNRNLARFLTNMKSSLLVAIMILGIFAGASYADNINLDMEGTTATVPKGNTIDRKIFGIPNGIPGTLKVKLKWHAVSIIPNTFNILLIKLMHGDSTLKSTNCYSVHSNKSPKCDFTFAVSGAEADKSGTWKLKITNNSGDEVTGFNIEKGSDINPTVPSFNTVYVPDCPDQVNLDMEGTTLTLTKGSTQDRKLFGIGAQPGVLRLRAKWHAVSILPTFSALKVDLLKPNGQVANTGTYYSLHSNKSPKLDFFYTISAADAALQGNWKLRITNNSDFEVTGFNIEKEIGEINPLVPSFSSSYKVACN